MKKLFLFISVPIAVIVLAVLALVLFINPNQFKPLIVDQAKQQTGLELVIDGDISWQFFPSLGFGLGKTELKNPAGFSAANMLSIEKVGLAIEVMPLLDKQLVIGNVDLDGAHFAIETLKNGASNLDVLSQPSTAKTEQTTESTATNETPSSTSNSAVEEWQIKLAGISVTNAQLQMQNQQTASNLELFDLNFTLTEFALDKWTHAAFDGKGRNGEQSFSATGKVDLKLGQGFTSYEIKNLEFDGQFTDPTTNIEQAKVVLASLNFGSPNTLEFTVTGRAADLDIDAKASTQLTIDSEFNQIVLDKLVLDSSLEGKALPQSPMKVTMDSGLTFDVAKGHLAFALNRLTANKLEFDGKADVTLADIPKIRFNLHSPNIDLDEFLGLTSSPATASTGDETASSDQTASKATVEVEPDLSALKGLDVKGSIVIDKFKAANAKLEKVTTKFSVNRGVAKLTTFSANLYQGSIKATGQLDARKSPASYVVNKQIKGVKVHPLLVDVAQFDLVEGTGNISVDVKGKSLKPSELKKNLAGVVKINFADGSVYGVNLPHMIRSNYAKFKGQSIEGGDQEKKTDFSALTATLNLNKGVMNTTDMHMESPLLRVTGSGEVDYVNETVDMLIRASIVGSLEGQGGKDIEELRDLTIPVNVSGSWTQPQYKLVFDDVLKEKAKKEAERGLKKLLKDKVGEDDTKKLADQLLKGLFN